MNKLLQSDIHKIPIQLGELEGEGGEGKVYRAENVANGEKLAVKLFGKRCKAPANIERARYLIGLNLHRECPVLVCPFDTIVNGVVGHVARWAEGTSLGEFLDDPFLSFSHSLRVSLAVAHGLDVLHSMGIAQGDIHPQNVKVQNDGDVPKVSLLDFDNFRSHATLPPTMAGDLLYLAPELRKTRGALPDIGSDLFELTVLNHEILLGRHPAVGHDSGENGFYHAMCSGLWVEDRMRVTEETPGKGGFPVKILNPEIENLFRRGFSLQSDVRPRALEWKQALLKALDSMAKCPGCGAQFLVDSSKINCPVCGGPFPDLRLAFNGRTLRLASGTTRIGRADLDNAPRVSKRHLIFHKVGPITWMTAIGSNPTFRLVEGEPFRLNNDVKILVQKGDRIRLADIDVQLV